MTSIIYCSTNYYGCIETIILFIISAISLLSFYTALRRILKDRN